MVIQQKMHSSNLLTGIPNVKSVATSSSVPGGGNPGAYSEIENTKGDLQIANLDLYFVDFDYINQFKIKMVAGRGFSKDFATDTTQAMVLNEAAVKMFGYTSPATGNWETLQTMGKRRKDHWCDERFSFPLIADNLSNH